MSARWLLPRQFSSQAPTAPSRPLAVTGVHCAYPFRPVLVQLISGSACGFRWLPMASSCSPALIAGQPKSTQVTRLTFCLTQPPPPLAFQNQYTPEKNPPWPQSA